MKMTSNLLRNLMQKSATRSYPVEVREPFENARGELYNDIDQCIFCSSCALKCPSQCITVDKKTATWECDPFACVYCGICVEVCPVNCLHQKKTWRPVAREREHIAMKGVVKPPKKKKKTEEKK